MPVLPREIASRIQFCEAHTGPWAANAVAIGTTSAIVTDFTTKTTAARAALAAQENAQNVAKAATNTLKEAMDAVSIAAQTIIDQVRVKAVTAGDGVYSLALLPAPSTPTPVTTLGTPTNFKAILNQDGSLTLGWKCVSPRATGVAYSLYRKLDDATSYSILGGTGKKKFVDSTIPAGTAQVMYKIQATRSTGVGPWATFVVTIGNSSTGQLTVTQPKLAA